MIPSPESRIFVPGDPEPNLRTYVSAIRKDGRPLNRLAVGVLAAANLLEWFENKEGVTVLDVEVMSLDTICSEEGKFPV